MAAPPARIGKFAGPTSSEGRAVRTMIPPPPKRGQAKAKPPRKPAKPKPSAQTFTPGLINR